MLLEIGIGDAYGAGFEFSSLEKIKKHNNLESYQAHELGMSAGRYTDDTQMSLALAELLIEEKPWNKITIADKFVGCFKRDIREGYSKGFFEFMKSVSSGKEFIEKINPISTRNGAAMRAAPIGVIRNIDDVLGMSEIQATLTHDTEIGIKSAQAVSLAAHYFLHFQGKKQNLCEFVCEHTKYWWNSNWAGEVACCGEQTVNALLTVLTNCSTLRQILVESVGFSGDVDTVAALGLGIASLSKEYEKTLPNFLFDDLENGAYGRNYLQSVGINLLKMCDNG